MRVAVHDHQNKAFRLIQALLELGHEIVFRPPADLLLLDQDSLPYYQSIIDRFPGTPIIVYPHGALSWACWDAGWEVNERTIGQLVIGEGAAEAVRAYGYPRPVKSIGWFYGPRSPFVPQPLIESVLFAPIHALGNGEVYPPAAEANGRTFNRLLDAVSIAGLRLVVRALGDFRSCGLWLTPSASYIEGSADVNCAQSGENVVVGYETFAYAAVARGQPTVMMGQEIPYWTGHGPEEYRQAAHWNSYREHVRFPFDADQGDFYFLAETLKDACRSDGEIRDWRSQFIGEPMTSAGLDVALKELMT
jgi:hypothetical protein